MSQSFANSSTFGKKGSANLSKSTYVSDDKTLKAMNNRISSGKSKPFVNRIGVIGGSASMSPKVESKLNSLAMLLQDEDNFQDVFRTKH
jgi:hypothetical protein